MKHKDTLTLFGFICVCLLAGMIGSVFTFPSLPTWYEMLHKPFMNPPNWVFGPVWTTLFMLMGISVYLVWKNGLDSNYSMGAFKIFWVQLIFNVLWSYVFFCEHLLFMSCLEIVALWMLIALTSYKFYRISRPAGLLLLPYLLWVTFASYLTFSIWMLNK